MLTIFDTIKDAHKTACEKGWWDEPRSFAECLALVHSEVSEALEAVRDGHAVSNLYFREDGKPEGVPAELADVVIRIADMCGYWGINLEKALIEKLAFNKSRPHRHGGKAL